MIKIIGISFPSVSDTEGAFFSKKGKKHQQIKEKALNCKEYKDPFGWNTEGNWNGALGQNKYQYNGKEWNDDFGLGWNFYGARFYDASVARWQNIDIMASFFPNENSYNFVGNNPVRFIDVQGMFKIDAYFAKRFPNLTTVIASYLPMLKDNPQIIEAFTEVTGFTEAQFSEMVKYGAGPWITPTRPEIFKYGNPAPYQDQNQYEPDFGYLNNLFLTRLQELENNISKALSNHDAQNLSANMFVFSIMVLHEAAHYAHYKTYGKGINGHKDIRWGGSDKGFDFFRKAFGTDFTIVGFVDEEFDRDKARQYAIKNANETHLFGMTTNGSNYDRWIWEILRSVKVGQIGDPTVLDTDRKEDKKLKPLPPQPCGCFKQ